MGKSKEDEQLQLNVSLTTESPKNIENTLDKITNNFTLTLNNSDLLVLEQYIEKTDVHLLKNIQDFSKLFLAKYNDNSILQKKIFKKILNKIDLKEDKSDLLNLKTESLFYIAASSIKTNKNEYKNQIKLKKDSKALDLLDQANILKIDHNLNTEFEIENIIKNLIFSYPDKRDAFSLATKSLKSREDHFKGDHPAVLKGLINAAEVGYKHYDKDIKITALIYAYSAYNMALRINDLKSAEFALKHMSEIYKNFGNIKLADQLMSNAEYFKAKQNSEENKEALNQQIIIKKGYIDAKVLDIREKIQESILDNISARAAEGKWFYKTASIEYGVSGYLNDDFIKKTLGTELDKAANIKIVKMLCFEAINLGIMTSSDKNPTAAIIFAQKYPELITEIVTTHPEYFIDGYIAKLFISQNKDMLGLLNAEDQNNVNYNLYQELLLTPFIENRIKEQVLNPVAAKIKSGEWNKTIESEIIELASNHYFTALPSWLSTSTPIGFNLGEIKDATNIARLLIFKTIVNTITEEKSLNYNIVTSFIKTYHDLCTRVLKDHPEYVENKNIKNICTNIAYGPVSEDISLDQSKVFIDHHEVEAIGEV